MNSRVQSKQSHWKLNTDGIDFGKPGSCVGVIIRDDRVGLLIAFSDPADCERFFELKFRQSEKGMVLMSLCRIITN